MWPCLSRRSVPKAIQHPRKTDRRYCPVVPNALDIELRDDSELSKKIRELKRASTAKKNREYARDRGRRSSQKRKTWAHESSP